MSKFSLIVVSKENDGIIDGYWIQDHVGTLETATTLANDTSKLNHNQNIAVVDQVSSSTPMLDYFHNLKKLN